MADTQLTADDAKRLLSCMQLGIVIQHGDGHRYITAGGAEYDDDGNEPEPYGIIETTPLNLQLKAKDLDPIRCKQYGSLRSCFDAIDVALMHLEQPTLRERYDAGGDMLWGFAT